jgi:hypothetical protein
MPEVISQPAKVYHGHLRLSKLANKNTSGGLRMLIIRLPVLGHMCSSRHSSLGDGISSMSGIQQRPFVDTLLPVGAMSV